MLAISEIMTKDLITVTKDTPLYEAIELLADNRISGLPVIDGDMNLVGVLSEYDTLQLLSDNQIGEDVLVESCMTHNAVSFDIQASIIDICAYFIESKRRRVPIVQENRLVGVISRHDIIKVIMQLRKK
ncbi:MAG: CBS domain-containing protein [Candidatus Omnitrophota bacterium]|jgi:CBS domain-containing protein